MLTIKSSMPTRCASQSRRLYSDPRSVFSATKGLATKTLGKRRDLIGRNRVSDTPRKGFRPLRAAAVDDIEISGVDFYSILGLSPLATGVEIKSAYRGLMRDLHPDLAAASCDEEERQHATELAMLLNEVYDTLSDPERRVIYNALSGFATENSVNPFLDTRFPKDQVFVDEISCIGCGKCVRACPKTFEIEESLYGRARVIDQAGDEAEDVQIATEVCPVTCIHYVSLPQLSLLEEALARMPRTSVFILQRGGAGGVNVFQEAYRAFEKRRAALNERAQVAAAQQDRRSDWMFWMPGRQQQQQQQQQQAEEEARGQEARNPNERNIMTLAAAAARASRLWQSKNGRSRKPVAALSTDSGSSMYDDGE